LNAVVGKNGADFVGGSFDQGFQESGGGGSAGLPHQLYKGEFARAINGDIQIELSLGGLDLGDIDVEVADRVRP
jgi:hypothetical protein